MRRSSRREMSERTLHVIVIMRNVQSCHVYDASCVKREGLYTGICLVDKRQF